MAEPYVIRVSSQKGGVGKSIVAINFATALKTMGFKVLLVDSDFSNPSISVYLGLEDANLGYKEVFLGKVDPIRAIIPHVGTGLSVLPGTISAKQFVPNKSEVERLIPKIRALNYDFIVIDTQPGYLAPEVLRMYDEALVVTTPEMSSLLAAIKLAHVYNREKLKHNLVVNRVRNKKYELSIGEIEEIYESKVRAVLPEDEIVPVSVAQHIAAYTISRSAQFSKKVGTMARLYTGKPQPNGKGTKEKQQETAGLIAFLMRLFGMGQKP